MHFGIEIVPFGELADPRQVVQLALAAEASGWEGINIWDHMYYVGLLAGENDRLEVQLTGEGRAINRHNYSLEEVEESLAKPVVQRLLKLIRFRNEYPSFNGEFTEPT